MCITILAGKNATSNHKTLIGHNEDAPGKFLIRTHILKALKQQNNVNLKFEPSLQNFTLPNERAKLFWIEAYTCNEDPFVSSFCDNFINSNGVVICSNNCAYSREDNPELNNGGIGYAFRHLIAQQAKTAKDAIEIAKSLIKKYGYASSARSYAFADENEIFVMQIVNGKHFAIKRVPDDEVCVIPNHYTIHEFDDADENLIAYAKLRGWYDKSISDEKFDFAEVYQAENSKNLSKNTFRHAKALEILTGQDKWQNENKFPFSVKPAKPLDVATMKKILRAHNENSNPHNSEPLSICNNETLQSSIFELNNDTRQNIIRLALGRPCETVYLPIYFGISELPEDYKFENSELALKNHFNTEPEDLNYQDNAWFLNDKVQNIYTIDKNLLHTRLSSLEERLERELRFISSQIDTLFKANLIDNAINTMTGAVNSWAVSVRACLENLLES